MKDISQTIDTFYHLLSRNSDGDMTGKKHDLEEVLVHKRNYGSFYFHNTNGGILSGKLLDSLKEYISEHMIDVADNLERKGSFGVCLPLDRSRFTDNPNRTATNKGIYVSLIDKKGKEHILYKKKLDNSKMVKIGVSADLIALIEDYESTMKRFQHVVCILTGELNGKIDYLGNIIK